MDEITIAIAGGRTGGHLFPALAVAESLKTMSKDVNLFWIGTKDGMEARVVPEADYPFFSISAIPLRRNMSIKNLAIPFVLARGTLQSLRLLRKTHARAVFATGSFVCVPVLLAARLARTKILLQEQNSYPGLTTRLFARHAVAVFVAYRAVKDFMHPDTNVVETGNPLRPGFEIGSRDKGVELFQLNPSMRTLLIFGGSQGAEAINLLVMDNLERLAEQEDVQLVWQTGQGMFQECQDRFDESRARGVVLPFIDRMDLAYACADLVICRSGAMTLAELASAGKPAILVPYPYAAESHQEYNANLVSENGAAIVMKQKDIAEDDLVGKALNLMRDVKTLERMSESSRKLHTPNASDAIARAILLEVTG
ncbi:MAG: undecaprenyldiphospho-muramoylpentapeptide beta-N-acetylglucosaminyltransferase [Candidatus Zixiibacteriota bacterium]